MGKPGRRRLIGRKFKKQTLLKRKEHNPRDDKVTCSSSSMQDSVTPINIEGSGSDNVTAESGAAETHLPAERMEYPGTVAFKEEQGMQEFLIVLTDANQGIEDSSNSENVTLDQSPLTPQTPHTMSATVDPSTTLLLQVRKNLLPFLPETWTSVVINGGIHVAQCAKSDVLLIQRSIFFTPDGTVVPAVHGRVLSPEVEFWKEVVRLELDEHSVKEFTQNIVRMFQAFRLWQICRGVEKYESTWHTVKDCDIDHNTYQETRYQVTLRPKSCHLLVPSLKTMRCLRCNQLARSLPRRAASSMMRTPSKFKGNKYLNPLERAERLQEQRKEMVKLKRENRILREKVEKAITEDGVYIDNEISGDLLAISNTEEAQKRLTPIQKLFIEQQKKDEVAHSNCKIGTFNSGGLIQSI